MKRGVGILGGLLALWLVPVGCSSKIDKAPAGNLGVDGGGSTCKPVEVDTLRNPVYMLIVLDGSGSMSAQGKWDAASASLKTFFTDLATRADNRTAVGLTVFSDANDKSLTMDGGVRYSLPDVPIGLVDANQGAGLIQRITSTPQSNTPTREVLEGQYPVIDAYEPQPPLLTGGKKVLVLISDGVPNDPVNDPPKCEQMAANYFQGRGILTFSVGVGQLDGDFQSYDPRFMALMAVAGGTPRAGCNPDETKDGSKMCHFQITPGGVQTDLGRAFTDAINHIRGAVQSCTFDIDPLAGAVDPSQAQVVLRDVANKDTVLVQGAADGYTFDDPKAAKKLTLAGSACDQVHTGDFDVKILTGCVGDAGQ